MVLGSRDILGGSDILAVSVPRWLFKSKNNCGYWLPIASWPLRGLLGTFSLYHSVSRTLSIVYSVIYPLPSNNANTSNSSGMLCSNSRNSFGS
jgi:hypothetical protein